MDEAKEATPKVRSLTLNERGQVALTSLEDQLQFAQRLIAEQMISETFKNPQQVVVGMQYAKALGINEVVALKMMYVVKGRPCLYAEGPLSLVQRNPAFHKIEEFFIDENLKRINLENQNLKAPVFGAVTRVWRKGDDLVQEDYFTIEDLKRAGLDFNSFGKKKDVWDKWERIMLRYKARTLALRSKFADLIAGIPVAEYDYNFTPELKDVTPNSPSTSSYIADKFGSTASPAVAPEEAPGPVKAPGPTLQQEAQ